MAAEGSYADHQMWQDLPARPGFKGLVLPAKNNLDAVGMDQLVKMVNLQQRWPGPLTVRAGQTQLATIAANIHSGGRAYDPSSGAVARVWGAGTSAYLQGLGAIQTSLSGRPLTFVPFYTQISDEPWLIVADGNAMFKVRVSDGLVLPLGLPAPAAPTAVLSDLLTTRFAAFDTTDNTEAANWTATAGINIVDGSTAPAAPAINDIVGLSGNAIEMVTAPGTVPVDNGYSSIGGVPITVDASILQASPLFPASDDDLVHVWMRIDKPEFVSEVRIYLVCAAGFDPAVVPGTSTTANQDAYIRAFRSNDWTPFLAQIEAAVSQGQVIRDNTLTTEFQTEQPDSDNDREIQPGDTIASRQIGRQTSTPVQGGRGVWSELGIVGIPLRRGDWARIGTSEDRDWATLTGLVIVVITNTNEVVQVALDDFFLTGGFGPDTSDPAATEYTYYATNYDPRTGAEGNGTVMSTTPGLNPGRQRITVQPQAAADNGLRQRVYRTGGTINDTINFVGENTANGGQVVDTLSDEEIALRPEIPDDHFQPLPATNDDGTSALNSPASTIFGPLSDLVFACGNALQPGTLAACISGEIDHWPDDQMEPVCPSSEQLMNGCVGWGSAGWVFSRERLYAIYVNLVADGGPVITTQPTGCTPGLAARLGLCVTSRGICYVAHDGVRITQGGASEILSGEIRAIFDGETVSGVSPIDWTQAESISLTFHDERLWLAYKGTNATYYTLRYDFIGQQWDGPQTFADPARCYLSEPATAAAPAQLLMGTVAGDVCSHSGVTDKGTGIAFAMKTGAWDMGLPAVTKSMGDIQLDMDVPSDTVISLIAGLNNDIHFDATQTVGALGGRRRYQFTPFGPEPQRARNLTVEVSATVSAAASIHQIHVSHIPEPLTTTTRPTPWEAFPPGNGYTVGCAIVCDTADAIVPVAVDVDTGQNLYTQAAILQVQHNGRRKIFYSWPAIIGSQIRLRPITPCDIWLVFDIHWIFAPEPGRLAYWDSNYENHRDTYYTGLDLEVNTYGLTKAIVVTVDGVDLPAQNIMTTSRQVVHLTLTPGYGHVYKFRATDANPGSLYSHAWRLEDAPGEQTNWNQPITVMQTNADKWLKALVIRCDTFGLEKTLQIQANGVNVGAPLSVTASGPQVVMVAFPQVQGRVFRILPTDTNPGRVWEIEPIFDEEPLQLDRWETQQIDHGVVGYHMLLRGVCTIRSTADVNLALTTYNHNGAPIATVNYTIPSTAGVKSKMWVPFQAAKGVLYKYLFTSDDDFFLYREESAVIVQVWGGGAEQPVKPFGTDDIDGVRQRTKGPAYPEVALTQPIPPLA